ncbi:MAG: tandem-95 repeat protein [Isosphaerales bacterium]
MSSRSHNRRRRAVPSCYRIEELEGRTLLSITAQAFSHNVLEKTASTIDLSTYVEDSDSTATLTFDLVSTTTADGGHVSVDAGSGLVSYTPAANSPSQDSFSYFAQDTDGDTSATQPVTANLSSVAANPVIINEVEGQSTIGLTMENLPGAVQDVSSKPSYTFSNLQVANNGAGTVSLTNTHTGNFTYTPPNSTFTGNVIITYQVTDGTGTNNSTVEIDIGPIAADPVVWGTLASTTAAIPSTTVPSLKDRIHDVNKNLSYTFSNPIIASGDGTVSHFNPATGSFTYTAPNSTFNGVVLVRYTVTDGTNSTTGDATIVVAPLITQPVTVTELDHQSTVSLTIQDLPFAVQDVSSNPIYTFFNLRVADGGGSVPASGFDDSSVGAFIYTLPSPASPTAVHIEYAVSDGTNTANGVVTIQLAGIVANSAHYNVLQNSQATLPALAGRIDDVMTTPTLTFSNPSVPTGDGSAQFTDTTMGILSYTPPNPTFTGIVPVQYTVSDGTNSTIGVLNLNVAPLITSPLLVPVALQIGPTIVPSLVASKNVQDVSSNPSYTFSSLTAPPGDGTAQFTDTTTGALTYTPPFSSFFGIVQVTYTVSDGTGNSAGGDVLINVEQTIQPENDGPITAAAGKPLVIPGSRLLRNDIAAPDGLKPSIGSVGDAKNGTVVLNSNGSVTFTPTIPGPASFAYTDTDAENDASTVATVTLDVKRATTINWANPADIVHGTALSSTQLDATASVPGTFAYIPAAGSVLAVGNGQTLTVRFTPTDATDYIGDFATATINVKPAPPPGLVVQTHSFSGRVRRKVGGVIAQLHTTLSKLKTTYYSALVNWDDGVVQTGKLAKAGTHRFTVNASHKYRVAGSYDVSVMISDPLGDRLTRSFVVHVR